MQTDVEETEELALLTTKVVREVDLVISDAAGADAFSRAVESLDRSIHEVGRKGSLSSGRTWLALTARPMSQDHGGDVIFSAVQ